MVEYMPQFPGGEEALWKWIAESININSCCPKWNSRKVYVTFVVESMHVSRAKVVRGVDPSLDAEALRVVNALPKWNPDIKRKSRTCFIHCPIILN
jgi:protein TonB